VKGNEQTQTTPRSENRSVIQKKIISNQRNEEFLSGRGNDARHLGYSKNAAKSAAKGRREEKEEKVHNKGKKKKLLFLAR